MQMQEEVEQELDDVSLVDDAELKSLQKSIRGIENVGVVEEVGTDAAEEEDEDVTSEDGQEVEQGRFSQSNRFLRL